MEWLKDHHIVDWGYTEELDAKSYSQFDQWINKNQHYPLSYLADHRKEKRENLKNYWIEAESSLVFLFSYHEAHRSLNEFYSKDKEWNGLKIGSYTLGFEGFDYHEDLKNKLTEIGERFKIEYNCEYKIALDVHPVLDRDLAYRAGLGWFGKNSMLISREHGSFLLIGSLIFNKKFDFEQKKVQTDHCGQCQKCVESCPTNAIDVEHRTIKAFDCISTFTIEQFKSSEPVSSKMNLSSGFIFGCDICQDVCPWNKRIDRLDKIKSEQFKGKRLEIIDFF